MKEATGELNMTVVTIVAIAALMAFFYMVIWPNIKISLSLTSACSSAGTSTMDFYDSEGTLTTHCEGGICEYTDPDSGATSSKTCNE